MKERIKMKAYKGFNKDMTCRDFQYEEGKEYTHDGKVKVCESGFHACELPLDVLRYYDLGKSEFHEVELDGEISKSNEDTKVAAEKIKIGARINILGMIKAQIEVVKEKAFKGNANTSGDYSTSATSGISSTSATSGYSTRAIANDPESIAVAWGYESIAKGCLGAHIVISEWEYDGDRDSRYENYDYRNDKDHWHLKCAKCFQIDGERLKPDTYYKLENGEPVEVESEE